ncbi:MAG TPA: FkbM family methyltransferase [Chthoniobacterales bacterium]|nr:FkbM family methyltransferase [Chthoniobacterales bacterium]
MSAVGFQNMLKILVRSRSLRFTADMVRQPPTSSLARLRWSGRDIFYRSGTADPFVLYQVLLRSGKKAEYYVPPTLRPKIILDIGSNIGASIIYFHEQFPDAKIFGFEPHPDTFRILQQNVGHVRGVTVFNYGLGATQQRVSVQADQVNFGAFNTRGHFKDRGYPAVPVECEVRRLDGVLREIGIAQLDLIKIDCEGAEADVFSTLPDEILNQCQWIVGEFHDHTGFEVLARLAPHFHLDLKKKMFRQRFRFHACNISKMQELSRSDLDALQL